MHAENRMMEGRELIQLAVGVYQLILAFDGSVTLSVESSVRFEIGALGGEWFPENPHSAANLTALVGKKVVRVEEGSEDELHMTFAEAGTLSVSGKSPYGEAYQLTWPGGMHVV